MRPAVSARAIPTSATAPPAAATAGAHGRRTAVLALAEYALALWIGGGPPRLAGAVFLGVVVRLLVETADLGRRAHGAALGPGVVGAQLRAWGSTAALASTAALGTAAACGVASTAVRLPWAPAVAAAGGAVALVGIALALTAGRTISRD